MQSDGQYFIGVHPSPDVKIATVWQFLDGFACRVDASQKEKILSGEPPNVLVEHLPGWTFAPLRLRPGRHFPRIARPSNLDRLKRIGFNPTTGQHRSSIQESNGQLVALKDQIERIFRVVQPDPFTMDVFGHDIRNLLILASTEVEAHWKAVLIANGSSAKNTNDYVRLTVAMRLDEYSVSLPFYPWLKPVSPFANWNGSKSPTQDLQWYHAYNLVKHDREENFKRATMRSALHALCGCFVMMCAQFGEVEY